MSPQAADPLRNFEAFTKSLRNFQSWLGNTVPGAMDVDFMVERKGEFLVLEAKPWTEGVTLPYGQHLALLALSKLAPFQVYLVGEADKRLYLMPYNTDIEPVTHRKNGKFMVWFPPNRFLPMTAAGLRDLVGGWWEERAA